MTRIPYLSVCYTYIHGHSCHTSDPKRRVPCHCMTVCLLCNNVADNTHKKVISSTGVLIFCHNFPGDSDLSARIHPQYERHFSLSLFHFFYFLLISRAEIRICLFPIQRNCAFHLFRVRQCVTYDSYVSSESYIIFASVRNGMKNKRLLQKRSASE